MPLTEQRQRDFNARLHYGLKNMKNPDAREMFRIYIALQKFRDEQEYSAANTVDRIKSDTLTNAAFIIHDAMMKIEYGRE